VAINNQLIYKKSAVNKLDNGYVTNNKSKTRRCDSLDYTTLHMHMNKRK